MHDDKSTTPTWQDVLLNDDGEDLIYETPGDAARGNPLDIVTVATVYSGRDVLGLTFPRKPVAKEMARRWNAHKALVEALKGLIEGVVMDSKDKGISGFTGARLTDARAALKLAGES